MSTDPTSQAYSNGDLMKVTIRGQEVISVEKVLAADVTPEARAAADQQMANPEAALAHTGLRATDPEEPR